LALSAAIARASRDGISNLPMMADRASGHREPTSIIALDHQRMRHDEARAC
jgi:hypothetical protein